MELRSGGLKEGALVAGKYRVLRKLGEGGMGSVWLAKNEVTERDFAIKFLHPSAERTEDQLTRFFQEAKVAGRLRHPSIVEIFDAGSDPSLNGAPYLVMEVLDGVGLDEAIARAGALPLGVALEIMLDVCRALALAHDKGIIHRDLKPSNVFLHRVGNGTLVPKVLDFGISKVLVADKTGRHVTGMTRTGAILGSPLYMSPEQAAGDKGIDARSDVHALGVLLWECLAGRAPFVAETYGLLMVEIIQGERPHLGSVLPGIPASVEALMQRAIARDRNQRFSAAGAMADAIEGALAEIGHVTVLGARTGASDFMALLGAPAAGQRAEATSTTAAMELPKAATVAQPAATGPASPTPQTASEVVVPSRRSVVPLIAGLGVLVIGGVGIAIALSRSSNEPAAPEPSHAPAGTGALVLAPERPTVAPALPSEAPAPAPSLSAPSPAPSESAPVAKPRPKPTPKAPGTAKPAPSSGVVHHGVTSSGL
ncbi:MAG: protein kinase [Polyangiaceae bacterium]|nr:protein kinase [Polyangiaceae bacterium]